MKHIKPSLFLITLLFLIQAEIASTIKRGTIFDRNGRIIAHHDSTQRNRRTYPYGSNLVHPLGYLGRISPDDSTLLQAPTYSRNSFIGKWGIEKQYEELLHSGISISLTLDAELQKKICALLPDSTVSTVVVSNPQNGELYAAISWPAFDPVLFNLPQEERDAQWKSLLASPHRVLSNKLAKSEYAPASLLKPVVALAIPESLSIDMYSKSFTSCSGRYTYEKTIYNCHKIKGHNIHSLEDAFIQDCHTVFYQLGEQLEDKKINRVVEMLELDRTTFIDLPDERSGYISGEYAHNKRFGHKGETWKWQNGLNMNLSIGQSQYLTPIMISTILPKIYNSLNYCSPHLLMEINTSEGPIAVQSPKRRQYTLQENRVRQLKKSLFKIVNSPEGVGKRAKLTYLPIGGIAGSAETYYGNGECDALFSAVAPIDTPQVAVTVIIANGGRGEVAAADLTKKILDLFFETTKEGREIVSHYENWNGEYPTSD